MKRAILTIIGLAVVSSIVLGVLFTGSAASQLPGEQETVTGVSVDLEPEAENAIRDDVGRVLPSSADPGENTTVVYSDELGQVVVFTDEPVATGEIEVSGNLFDGPAFPIGDNIPGPQIDAALLADDESVEISVQSDTETDIETLQNNPEELENELVKVTTDYRQFTANSDVLDGEVVARYRTGSLTPMETTLFGEGAIGDAARDHAREVAESDGARDVADQFQGVRAIGIEEQNNYWLDTEVTIHLAVVDEGPEYTFFIADVELESTETTLEELNNGQHEDGDIVTVSGNFAGTRISIEETLIAASECSEDSFFVPNVGCVPAAADTVIEAGLLHEGTDWLLAAGISNRLQARPTVESYQEVQITGEVVDAGQIDPALAGRQALIIYDIGRQEEIDPADVPAEVLEEQTALTDRLDQQLTTTPEEYQTQVEDSQDEQSAGSNAESPQDGGQTETADSNTDTAQQEQTDESLSPGMIESPPDGSNTLVLLGFGSSLILAASGIISGSIGIVIMILGAVGIATGVTDISVSKGAKFLYLGLLLFLGGVLEFLLVIESPILALAASVLVVLWVAKYNLL